MLPSSGHATATSLLVLGIAACTEASRVPTTPSAIDPAILEGLEASGRSGLLIAALVVERAGPRR